MRLQLDNHFIGFIVTNNQGKIQNANAVAISILGLELSQLKDLHFQDLFQISSGLENLKKGTGHFLAQSHLQPKVQFHFNAEGSEIAFYTTRLHGKIEESLTQTFNSLELDEKIYQLELITNLLKKLGDLIETKEVLRNYAAFICEQLFIQAASVYCISDQQKIYFEDFIEFDGSLDFKNQRQKMHIIMKSDPKESFEIFRYLNYDEMSSGMKAAYEQREVQLVGIMQVPIFSKTIFLGCLHFLIYEPRSKISQKEINLIEMTLLQIKPFIDNSLNYRLAMTDELTKTYNKRMFNLYLEKYFSLFKQEKMNHLCLLLFDIDFFKKINDTHGHSGGDLVLHDFARVLAQSVRAGDTVFRIGGEEFAIILKESKDVAVMIADRIFQNLALKRFVVGHEKSIHVTSSCGISAALLTDIETSDIFDRADLLLYKSKHEGRNRISS